MSEVTDKDKFMQGTPPLLLLPAKNYIFKVNEEHFIIEIPRKGKYVELAPEIFKEEDGEFNIYDDESGILFLPSITKVLFAVNKYPELDFNQFFVPYSINIEDDKATLVGQIVEMMYTKKREDTEKED